MRKRVLGTILGLVKNLLELLGLHGIQLKVDKEMEKWLSSGGVDLDSLISELLTGFYRALKTV
jgi:hypothetical protein